jgi:FKBP-type peptidyl-prolyl cis-trans isomerase
MLSKLSSQSILVKFSVVFTFGVSIVACNTGHARKEKLETQKDKLSYAIGQQVGETIKNQGLEVDVQVLAQSIEDVTSGKKSLLTFEELRGAMMQAQKDAQAKQAKVGEENTKIGQEYLEKNKKNKDVVVTPSGLQYKVVKEGTGAVPKDSDTVVCHYRGKLINGTEFDSSYSRNEPAEFPVMGVIPGWTEALKTMKVGEKRELYIPSDLAYGAQGRPGIPPNSVLIFDIELLEIKKGPEMNPAHGIKPKAKGK